MHHHNQPPAVARPRLRGCLSAFARLIACLTERQVRRLPPRPARRTSFMPGQICLLAEHDRDLSAEEIVSRTRAALHRLDVRADVRITEQRVVTLRGQRRTLSLVVGRVPALRDRPRALIDLANELNRRLGAPSAITRRGAGPAGRPAAEGAPPSPTEPGAFQLRAASPNWLGGGAPVPGTVGGPGAQPQPYVASATTNEPWRFTLPENTPAPNDEHPEVKVVILDTAPGQTDLSNAYQSWGGQHALIPTLLGPNGKLTVSYAGYSNLLQLVDYNLEEHQYIMSSHGLFVAGIIHDIAPNAELSLIEVLNPYGVGSLETLVMGLAQVLDTHMQGQPLLLNCSLMLNLPQPEQEWIDAQALLDPSLQGLTTAQVGQISQVFGQICALLAEGGAIIVAAAGNDGSANQPRPPARYPARYPGVIGVAATTLADTLTSYTNSADLPESDGFATFGGDVAGGRGMLGVYIDTFPDGTPNQNGWAWWAGSSFATPVITALLARLIGTGTPPEQAAAELAQLKLMAPVINLIDVDQGSDPT